MLNPSGFELTVLFFIVTLGVGWPICMLAVKLAAINDSIQLLCRNAEAHNVLVQRIIDEDYDE